MSIKTNISNISPNLNTLPKHGVDRPISWKVRTKFLRVNHSYKHEIIIHKPFSDLFALFLTYYISAIVAIKLSIRTGHENFASPCAQNIIFMRYYNLRQCKKKILFISRTSSVRYGLDTPTNLRCWTCWVYCMETHMNIHKILKNLGYKHIVDTLIRNI